MKFYLAQMHLLPHDKHHFFKDFIFTIRDFYLESANKAISDLKFRTIATRFLPPDTHMFVFWKILRALFSCFLHLIILFFCLITDGIIYHFRSSISSCYFK